MEYKVGFTEHIGLVLDGLSADEVTGHVVIGPEHLQPAGLVHGGLYCAIAESMASMGAWVAAGGEGHMVAGISNNASFMRPVTDGTVHAVARPRHQGRTTAVWDTEISDDDGRVCVAVRVTLAIRKLES